MENWKVLPEEPVERKGRPVYRCTKRDCRAEIPVSSSGILAGSHLKPAVFLQFLYFWAHDCAGERAESMLGIGHTTIGELSLRLRLCVASEQADTVVMNETELGRKPKGPHGARVC